MDRATPAIRAEIDSLKSFYVVRDQWARTPNELPIDSPARLRFYRITSASASPNLNGQPETLAQMRSRVYKAFLQKGLLIFNIESIVAVPAPDYAGTVELSLLSDNQALIEYADSLGFTFLTFRKLFEPDPNYQPQLSINHDYPQIKSGRPDTLRILQNDLFPIHRDLRVAAITQPQHGQATIAVVDDQKVPRENALYSNYPNPFSANGTFGDPETTIAYSVAARSTHVILSIYNMLGQEMIRLVDEEKSAGDYKLLWDGKNTAGQTVQSGVYLCKMSATGFTQVHKILFLK